MDNFSFLPFHGHRSIIFNWNDRPDGN